MRRSDDDVVERQHAALVRHGQNVNGRRRAVISDLGRQHQHQTEEQVTMAALAPAPAALAVADGVREVLREEEPRAAAHRERHAQTEAQNRRDVRWRNQAGGSRERVAMQ